MPLELLGFCWLAVISAQMKKGTVPSLGDLDTARGHNGVSVQKLRMKRREQFGF